MAPTLYMTGLSPPARAVLLLQKAMGIDLKYSEINLLAGDHLKPEFVKMNPQHTIPLLLEEDGSTIWDSHAILSYLSEKYGKDDSYYPKDLLKRSVVDQRLHFDSGSIFSLIRRIVQPMLHKGKTSADDECVELANYNYNLLNTFIEGKKWMAGDHITIADFSLLSSVTSLNYLVPIDEKFGNLLKWIKNAEALPYYEEANGKGLKAFIELIDKLRKQ